MVYPPPYGLKATKKNKTFKVINIIKKNFISIIELKKPCYFVLRQNML